MMKAAYTIFYALSLGMLICAAPFSRKVRVGLYGRVGLQARIRRAVNRVAGAPLSNPLWFHFASSGEFEQCLPLLDAIKGRDPRQQIFLSYFSPTAVRALEIERRKRMVSGESIPWDYADFSPIDFPGAVRRFIRVLKPKYYVAIHAEIWPNLLSELRRAHVPRALVAAHFRQNSKSPKWYLRWLGRFQKIAVIDQESLDRLSDLLPKETAVLLSGDPRVERVIARKARARHARPAWKEALLTHPCLVWASVWEEDLDAIIPILATLSRTTRSIFVPHEPSEKFIAALEKRLDAVGLEHERWSEWLQSSHLPGHLIIDGVGQLAELYEEAALVFVGGSFKKKIHNVLEPAVYGKAIFCGPHFQNSREAVEMSVLPEGFYSCHDGPTLEKKMLRLLADSDLRTLAGRQLRNYLEQRQGASAKTIDFLFTRSKIGEKNTERRTDA